jgi:anti-sigma factor RsiW
VTGQHPLDRLGAAVDGELGHDARDKVFAHLVGCQTCRVEVEADRRTKSQLSALDHPAPSEDLVQRLLGISSFGTEAREEVRPVVTPAVTMAPARSAFPAARTRPPTRSGGGSRRRTVVLGAAGSAAAVASLLGTAFAIGEPAEQPPLLQPPVSSFSVDHASTTNAYPFGDPAALLPSLHSGAFYQTALTGTANPGPPLVQPAGTEGR